MCAGTGVCGWGVLPPSDTREIPAGAAPRALRRGKARKSKSTHLWLPRNGLCMNNSKTRIVCYYAPVCSCATSCCLNSSQTTSTQFIFPRYARRVCCLSAVVGPPGRCRVGKGESGRASDLVDRRGAWAGWRAGHLEQTRNASPKKVVVRALRRASRAP